MNFTVDPGNVGEALEELEELCCVHDGVGLRRSSLDSLKRQQLPRYLQGLWPVRRA